MEKRKNFAIIGGDTRQVRIANRLCCDGHTVKVFGFKNLEFESNVKICDDLNDEVSDADVVILPLPTSVDDQTINTPFYDSKIYFADLFKKINKNTLLLCGKISEKFKNLAHVYNVYTVDYFDREELTVLNAIPTSEGAIQIAMEELPVTIHGSRDLVLGFGRIGKVLSKMLDGLGADVTVAARKYSDIAWIKTHGYNHIGFNELSKVIGQYDVIFNTIPAVILDINLLSKVNKDSLIIDLASKPGGVEFESAKDLGVRVIWALSIPGKVAPHTAGDIIKDTILNIINELGV